MTPRLIGFNSQIEKQFFEVFCSVDGVGVKKALRAMVRPVPDVAVGNRTAGCQNSVDVARHRGRHRGKNRGQITPQNGEIRPAGCHGRWDDSDSLERSIVDETYQILIALGHSESDARKLLELPISSKKKYKDVESLLQAVYDQSHAEN